MLLVGIKSITVEKECVLGVGSLPPPLSVCVVQTCEYVYGCLHPTMFTGGQRKPEKDICIFFYLYPITVNESLLLNWKLAVLAG